MQQYISLHSLDEAQRLFHGRGHAYPELSHVNVDWLPPIALITLYQEVGANWLNEQAQWLFDSIEGCESVQVQYRCREKAPTEVLLGDSLSETVVTESGLRYEISLGKAQNTGLFLDMKNGRDWVQANSQDKTVLNLFSYTCAFSVAAIAGGAERVVNIDLSKASLAKGRDNHRLNEHDVSKVVFQGIDIFKSFGRIKKYGPYQLMISDPPSFQKGSVDIAKDYKKIIKRIPEFMAPSSDLLLCLNSPDLDEQFLFDTVEEHCADCKLIGQIKPPEVFKEAHQGKGLKVFHYRYQP